MGMMTAPAKSEPPATIPDDAPQPRTTFHAVKAAVAADNDNDDDNDDDTAAMLDILGLVAHEQLGVTIPVVGKM